VKSVELAKILLTYIVRFFYTNFKFYLKNFRLICIFLLYIRYISRNHRPYWLASIFGGNPICRPVLPQWLTFRLVGNLEDGIQFAAFNENLLNYLLDNDFSRRPSNNMYTYNGSLSMH